MVSNARRSDDGSMADDPAPARPAPRRISAVGIGMAVVLGLLVIGIQVMNVIVYRTTGESGSRIDNAGVQLSRLADLQSEGHLWVSAYADLETPLDWVELRARQETFTRKQEAVISDTSLDADVRNDLQVIANLLPEIDRLTSDLEAASSSHRTDVMTILEPRLEELTTRTGRLFERENARYLEDVNSIIETNRSAQRSVLVASGLGIIVGLSLVVMGWRRARSRLERAYHALLEEVQERKAAETALRESEARFQSVLSSVKEIVFECRPDGRWLSLTPAWTALTGYTVKESLGRDIADIIHPDDRASVARELVEALDSGTLRRMEVRCITREENRIIELRFQAMQSSPGEQPTLLGTINDVSDRHELETRLRQAQKLESVGSLAAGIAHEINTPIQFIGNNLLFIGDTAETVLSVVEEHDRLIREAIATGDRDPRLSEIAERSSQLLAEIDFEFCSEELPQAVTQSLEGVERVASIVGALKKFGHPEQSSQHLVDINEILKNTAIVARSEYKEVAELELKLGDVSPVLAHSGDLGQVFLNLIVNASHAIAEVVRETHSPGVISAQTYLDGSSVVVEIIDTGCGIPPEIRDRIFDPFFTTKEVGQGTGQGLAIARSLVVDRNGGTIEVESEVGVGTTVRMRFPVSDRPA